MIGELESKTDMIILLFNASEKDLNRLKTKDYPIDFTIRSRSNLPPAVSKDGGSASIPIYSIGMRGKYVFEFDINIGDSSSDFIDLMYTQSNLDKANNFLNSYNVNSEESIDLDSEFSCTLHKLVDGFTKYTFNIIDREEDEEKDEKIKEEWEALKKDGFDIDQLILGGDPFNPEGDS